MYIIILSKSERPNHKYIRKYKSKSGKWIYVYKESQTSDNVNRPNIKSKYVDYYNKAYNYFLKKFQKFTPEDKKEFQIKFKNYSLYKQLFNPDSDDKIANTIIEIFNKHVAIKKLLGEWTTNEIGIINQLMKVSIANIENGISKPIIRYFSNEKILNAYKSDKNNIDKAMLKLRALGQAFLNTYYKNKTEFDLYRGISGVTGSRLNFEIHNEETIQVDYIDNSLSSYTIDKDVTEDFNLGGISIKMKIPKKDIFIPPELLYLVSGSMKSYYDEQEFIVIGKQRPIKKENILK